MSNVLLSSSWLVALKSNVVNSTLDDLVVHFVSKYCTEGDGGTCTCSFDGMGGLVVLPEIITVDGDSRTCISVVDLVEEIYWYVLVSLLLIQLS